MSLGVNFLWSALVVGIYLTKGVFAGAGISTKAVQCGGVIEADSDSLSYPGPEQLLQPGEVCVWTIHLQTTRDFKFNVSHLDVSSAEPGCSNAGLRIYSLTNLASADDSLNYTLCNSEPGFESFLLGESIAVVVLYTSASDQNPGSGFTISWEGNTYDPLRTKHLSSFTTISSDIIRYPVVGHYEPRLAVTWLVKSITSPELTRTQFQLDLLDLESCGITDDICRCDGLFLYEISPLGILTESERFCGDFSEEFSKSIESTFILAFFTDFETQSDGGGGFQVLYYATEVFPTTTVATTPDSTTEGPETTTLEPTTPHPTDICGEVLSGSRQGVISYKSETTYRTHERCVWTVRVPDAVQIQFTLYTSNSQSDSKDGINLSALSRSSNGNVMIDNKNLQIQNGVNATVNGTVVIVTFFSDEVFGYNGFDLIYQAIGNEANPIISSASRDRISHFTGNTYVVNHPIEGSGYDNQELSTFVISYPEFYKPLATQLKIEISLELAADDCSDMLSAFMFNLTSKEWIYSNRLCDSSNTTIDHRDIVLLVFASDDEVIGGGIGLVVSNLL